MSNVENKHHHNSELYKWKNVTQEFFTCSKELNREELLHDNAFGLYEAMSAIEMMDPKMDAGMKCNRKNRKPFTFKTAKESGHLLDGSMVPHICQVSLIDSTLCCFVTWLEGHSLAQTVFTNIYLHSPEQIENLVIKAVSIVFLKLVDIIRDFVTRASVNEEEDFQTMLYGFNLSNDITESKCCSLLREAEENCVKTMPRSVNSKMDESVTVDDGLLPRIRFLRFFYLALISLNKREISDAKRLLLQAKECMVKIRNSSGHCDNQENRKDTKNYMNTSSLPPMGFDPLANQRLLPPTFPRYTEIITLEGALDYLYRLVNRLISLSTIAHVSSSLYATMDFFVEFSSGDSCVLSRSVLQLLFFPLDTTTVKTSGTIDSSLPDLLREACLYFIAPPVLYVNAQAYIQPQVIECVDKFFVDCCTPIRFFFKILGLNQARQRDRLAGLLGEFVHIQDEAERLDSMLNNLLDTSTQHQLCFSAWVLHTVVQIMIKYIISGLQLELYSVHEFCYIFWYLHELIFPYLSTCLHRAESCVTDFELYSEIAMKSATNSIVKNKKKTKSGSRRKGRPFAKDICYYYGFADMCAGYLKLMIAMKKESKFSIPDFEFGDEKFRYEHRFEPFLHLNTPPHLSYSQYRDFSLSLEILPSGQLYSEAAISFTNARKTFEEYGSAPVVSNGRAGTAPTLLPNSADAEVLRLIRIAKINMVASNCLSSTDFVDRNVRLDFKTHSVFPTVSFN